MSDIYCDYHATDTAGSRYCRACSETRREPYRTIDRGRPLTDSETIEYLSIDTGDAPCSRYGTKPGTFQPVIVAALNCIESKYSRRSIDSIEHMAELVVNDSELPARLIVSIGPNRLGLDPTELLDNETIGQAWIQEANDYGETSHYVAAALVDFIQAADYVAAIDALEQFLDDYWSDTYIGPYRGNVELDDIDSWKLGQALGGIVADNVARDALTTRANIAKGERI